MKQLSSNITRRELLKLLPTLPFYKVSWPLMSGALTERERSIDKPNILVLVLDTLSARHMSLFGYRRNTTPHLARFAERATVYHAHHATANFTSPGTSSIFTGVYPWLHRAFHLHGLMVEPFATRNIFGLMPDFYTKTAYTHNLWVFSLLRQFHDEINRLQHVRDLCLQDRQWSDRLFVEDYSIAYRAESAYLRGNSSAAGSLFGAAADRAYQFLAKSRLEQRYEALYPRGLPELQTYNFLLEDAIDWIVDEVANLANPFFGYFHLLPPHEPYRPRRDFVGIFQNDDYQPLVKPTHFSARIIREQRFLEQKRLEYDEFLAFTDAEFGRLYDTLQRWDLLENSYLIVTSDHGQLFERGVHGHNNRMLFEPLLHVPLLIARPGQNKREDIFDNTSNVDLLPTILHITGQPIPSELEGQILPNFAPNSSVGKQRSIFALEAKSNPKSGPLNNATIAIIKEQYKLVHYIGDYTKRFELFDLSNDPEEMNDLFERNLAITAVLQEELDEKIRSMD